MSKLISLICIIFLSIAVIIPHNNATSLTNESSISNLKDNFFINIDQKLDDNLKTFDSIEEFGNQEDFWTANLQTNEWFTVRATLLAIGENCYIYMDNRTIVSIGQTEAIRRSEIYSYEFDTTIYPKNFELMGHPNGTLGDIDGDPRITVFLVQGVGSYYLQHNELEGAYYSNNREMVFVNSQMPIINTIAIICHETNHLFLFNYDLNEAVFMIEGLAEFSMYYAGYMSNSSFLQAEMNINVSMSAAYFAEHPSVSLMFFDEDYHSYASYGAGYMFLFYLAEKYGIEVIKSLIGIDHLDGTTAIENVLMYHGYDIGFNDIFLDFITACTIDELGISNNLYGFVNADYQILVRDTANNLPKTFSDIKYRYYGIEIMDIYNAPDEFTIELETPSYPGSLGIVIAIQDDNGWNITQLISSGNGTIISLYCNGDNIQNAYIITSMINLGISCGPRLWDSSPYHLLDITIKEGHIKPSETTMMFLSTSIALTFMCSLILFVKRKRKTRCQNNP